MIESLKQFIRDHLLEIIMGVLTALFIANIPTIAHASGSTDTIIKDGRTHQPLALTERLKQPKLPKLVAVTKIIIKPTTAPHRASSAPAGYYPPGQCTHLVWTKRAVPAWGDATEWLGHAKAAGWTISTKPVKGAIAWRPGHVAFVERVISSTTVLITEANYDYQGSVRTIAVPTNSYTYLY